MLKFIWRAYEISRDTVLQLKTRYDLKMAKKKKMTLEGKRRIRPENKGKRKRNKWKAEK